MIYKSPKERLSVLYTFGNFIAVCDISYKKEMCYRQPKVELRSLPKPLFKTPRPLEKLE